MRVRALHFNATGDAGDAAAASLLFWFCQGAYSATNPSPTNHKSNDIPVLLFQQATFLVGRLVES
jgi:hypothetical protein